MDAPLCRRGGRGADSKALAERYPQYDTTLMLPPGEFTIKFLARENQSGKMGTC